MTERLKLHVRIWRNDGSVFDRPARLIVHPETRRLMVEWNVQPNTERGTLCVAAVQMFLDNGVELGDREDFAPQMVVLAWEREPDVWTFRLAHAPNHLERMALLP